MNAIKQLEHLMNKNGITKYRLSKLSGQSTSYIYASFNEEVVCSLKQIARWSELLGFDFKVVISERDDNNE